VTSAGGKVPTTTSDEVQYTVLYKGRPLYLQLHVLPFIILYAAWAYVFTAMSETLGGVELAYIGFALIGCVQILVCLCCVWSVHFRSAVTCTKVQRVVDAQLVKVVPTPNNGYPEMVPLRRSLDGSGNEMWWIDFQKTVLICDDASGKGNFQPVSFPVDWNFDRYNSWRGYETPESLKQATAIYGVNDMEMVIPDFWTLFQERATAPFFVFQVFCVGLWCLDESWYYSLFTLFMLVIFEVTLVQQQMRNMSTIRQMGNKPTKIHVYRGKKWEVMMSNELVAGDVISLVKASLPVSCDLLLLRGQCIVDEAMLTGESVPQMKEPIYEVLEDGEFNVQTHGKLHVVFGGTKVIQTTTAPKTLNPSNVVVGGIKAPPDHGCICYVLRTGFYTSQGKLLKTILFGVKRVTANSLETFFFILFLLIFAIAASAYVWVEGTKNPERSRYKLFLECTLIITSVVPPELPIELSLAVNSSMLALSKLHIFCTEPFRIPFAGKVDFCCFDKTGTLTSDNFIVDGVAGLNGSTAVLAVNDLPKETLEALATCHSLGQMGTDLIGDPLEKATLSAINYTLSKNDVVAPRSKSMLGGALKPWQVVHRYHFTSSLKRMTSLAAQTSEMRVLAAVKGAPETLKPMYREVPDRYDEMYKQMTLQGSRVLAIGYKYLHETTVSQGKSLSREEVETDLEFGGFLIVSCPLKPDSKAVMKTILDSAHYVTMITGDNPLTACHVAKQLKIVHNHGPVLLLQRAVADPDSEDHDRWVWRSITEDAEFAIDDNHLDKLWVKYNFCLTGEGLEYLQTHHPARFTRIIPRVAVFARVAPKQKETVITVLKSLGFYTLMCGDGTNDVGALKHAHCGVALLPNSNPAARITVSSVDEPPMQASRGSQSGGVRQPITIKPKSGAGSSAVATTAPRDAPRPSGDGTGRRHMTAHQRAVEMAEKMQKDLDDQEMTVVKLGDASIASPFTSKLSSINSVCHIIKQGRCTLVTTLQMFKILALNALIFAYGQSVLYLDGVKFSDTQATLQGLLLAGCFLFVSRSRPLTSLSKQRPLPNIFNAYTLLTVIAQFGCHFASLIFLVRHAKSFMPVPEGEFADLETEFSPNLLNSTVYLIDMAMQINTFAVNYRGHPFMESLWENKMLRNSLGVAFGVVLLLAGNLLPDLSLWFELVDFPDQFRNTIVAVIVADCAGCYVLDRTLRFIFGRASIRKIA
jgi:cation-transporting ATPase 13A1